MAAAIVAGGVVLGRAGLPSSYLFAALLLGLALALRRPGALDVQPVWFRRAQAVAGVTLGAYLQTSALRELAHDWLPVTLVSAATLGLSLGAGMLLARTTTLDEPTAALGLIAGGASGIVGMSGELGADDRLVAFMQYLRVLIVVASTPLFIAVFFPGAHADASAVGGDGPILGDLRGWLLTGALALAGALLATRARLTAGVLLGPMIVTGVVVLAVPGGAFTVPPLLRETASRSSACRSGCASRPTRSGCSGGCSSRSRSSSPPCSRRASGWRWRSRRRRPPRCWTPTSPRPPAGCTPCSRSPRDRAPTRPSSSPCSRCASS